MQVDKNCNATVTTQNNQITNARVTNIIPSNGMYISKFKLLLHMTFLIRNGCSFA